MGTSNHQEDFKKAAEQRAEAERLREVTLLLENLFGREQATVKAIFSCLFDIGLVNLVNNKVNPRLLRPVVKPVGRLSKSAFIFIGYRWFVKNCPDLITNWLKGQVQFKPARKPSKPEPTYTAPPVIVQTPDVYRTELRRLRSQVRVTTGALVGVSVILMALLMGLEPQQFLPQSSQPSRQKAVNVNQPETQPRISEVP